MRLAVPRASTAVALGAMLVTAGAYVVVPDLRRGVDGAIQALSEASSDGAIDRLRAYVLGFGPWAPLVSALLMVLQSVVAPLPAFVVTFTNGLVFGWAWGSLLSWSSALAGAGLCFWIARAVGRPPVERILGGARVLDAADRFFAEYGRRAILVARLLPFVPFDAISYGAGLTSTPFRSFLLATAVGQIPATLLYSYLGERAGGSVRALFWTFSIVTAVVVAWAGGPRLVAYLRPGRRAQGGPVE